MFRYESPEKGVFFYQFHLHNPKQGRVKENQIIFEDPCGKGPRPWCTIISTTAICKHSSFRMNSCPKCQTSCPVFLKFGGDIKFSLHQVLQIDAGLRCIRSAPEKVKIELSIRRRPQEYEGGWPRYCRGLIYQGSTDILKKFL